MLKEGGTVTYFIFNIDRWSNKALFFWDVIISKGDAYE
jgi:hypothetical protein